MEVIRQHAVLKKAHCNLAWENVLPGFSHCTEPYMNGRL